MYDPMIVAHEIKSPIRGAKSKFFPKGYRNSLITIWHVDPERRDKHLVHSRGDDTCGWFHPPMTIAIRDEIDEMGRNQFSQLFGRRHQLAKGDPQEFAYICYEPSAYDAVYWAWRAIKNLDTKHVWQYGRERRYLTADELEYIYSLSANPVDNFRSSVEQIADEEACGEFFVRIYSCYLRFNRPWWHHPRWHLHHWRLQIHPWQLLRRRLLTRCAGCGEHFAWNESPVSHQWDTPRPKFLRGEVGLYHDRCSPPLRQPSAPGVAPADSK